MINKMKKPAAVPVNKLHPFEGHPYKVIDNDEMDSLVDSIKTNGILSPLIVMPMENTTDEYEVVSGHRRLHAAVKAGLSEVPAFVCNLDRDAAAIAVVDSNLHREHILPSEKAFAYKMKLDAIKHQGKADSTSRQVVGKSESADSVSADESGRTVQRYIRLTKLIPGLLDLMDKGKMALSVGVELSYLDEESQTIVLKVCETNDCTPSYSQSWHLHQSYKDGSLNKLAILNTLTQEKANQREMIKIPVERLKKIIPESFTVKQTEDFLIRAAAHYQRFLENERKYSR